MPSISLCVMCDVLCGVIVCYQVSLPWLQMVMVLN